MTSEDGYSFDNLLCLHGEVPPKRYYGWAKNTGPQYIRGIFEGNGEKVRDDIDLDIETKTLERMVFRTGSWRSDVRQFILDGQPHGPGMDKEDLAAAGEKVAQSVFWIDNVKTK